MDLCYSATLAQERLCMRKEIERDGLPGLSVYRLIDECDGRALEALQTYDVP